MPDLNTVPNLFDAFSNVTSAIELNIKHSLGGCAAADIHFQTLLNDATSLTVLTKFKICHILADSKHKKIEGNFTGITDCEMRLAHYLATYPRNTGINVQSSLADRSITVRLLEMDDFPKLTFFVELILDTQNPYFMIKRIEIVKRVTTIMRDLYTRC